MIRVKQEERLISVDKKWKIGAAVAVLLSLALLFIPKILPICDSGCGAMMPMTKEAAAPMACYYTYRVVLLISLASLLVSGSLFWVKGAEGRRLNGLFLALLGLLAVLVPQSWIIGTCGSPSMGCNKVLPWVYGAGTLLIITGVVLAWLAPRSAAEQNAEQEEGV